MTTLTTPVKIVFFFLLLKMITQREIFGQNQNQSQRSRIFSTLKLRNADKRSSSHSHRLQSLDYDYNSDDISIEEIREKNLLSAAASSLKTKSKSKYRGGREGNDNGIGFRIVTKSNNSNHNQIIVREHSEENEERSENREFHPTIPAKVQRGTALAITDDGGEGEAKEGIIPNINSTTNNTTISNGNNRNSLPDAGNGNGNGNKKKKQGQKPNSRDNLPHQILKSQQSKIINDSASNSAPGLHCVCDTKDCLSKKRAFCITENGICYKQFLEEGNSSSPFTKGCIDESTSPLCENRRPAAGGQWPWLYCCKTDFCNANLEMNVPKHFSIENEKTNNLVGGLEFIDENKSRNESEVDEFEHPSAKFKNFDSNTNSGKRSYPLISPLAVVFLIGGAFTIVGISVIGFYILRREQSIQTFYLRDLGSTAPEDDKIYERNTISTVSEATAKRRENRRPTSGALL